jgi:hypothetical protein
VVSVIGFLAFREWQHSFFLVLCLADNPGTKAIWRPEEVTLGKTVTLMLKMKDEKNLGHF